MIRQHFLTPNTHGLGNTKEYIVLHHTGTDVNSVQAVLQRFQTGPVSAHYVIGPDGAIYAFNSDDDILRHAGESSWNGKIDLNRYSIGIELIGPLPGFTDQQKIALKQLIRHLMKKYQIPYTNIIRHRDIAPGRKVDPDDSLRYPEYPDFASYQKSFVYSFEGTTPTLTKVGKYQKLYQKVFGSPDKQKDLLLPNLSTMIDTLRQTDGSIDIQEVIFLFGIAIEKLYAIYKKQKHLV